MKKIIHNIRRQPEDVRRHVLHIIMFVIIIIMAVLWIYSLNKNFSNPDTSIKIKQDLEPFSNLKNNLTNN